MVVVIWRDMNPAELRRQNEVQPDKRRAQLTQRVDPKRVVVLTLRWLGFLAAVAALVLLIRFLYQHR